MGMSSPEVILLVENCPKGAETLVTRIIHILTENGKSAIDCQTIIGRILKKLSVFHFVDPPSPELVDRVRELYHKRVDDVRFLIPVLPGLSKKEVISALPQLIKLNPIVVKEVINRSVFCFR